jgi:IgA Peptidase M64/FG-GAP-like repeat
MADSMTTLRAAGPAGAKRNLAILGDGFAAGDQTTYNNWVQTVLMDGVFKRDYFFEDASAWNIYRVNLISNDSGVSQRVYDEHGTPADSSDDTITSTTLRDTALGMIFSGSWAHCWLEYGANTENRIQAALNKWVPDYNFVLIILNDPNFGGCGGGGRAHVPMGVDWTTIAHEFGHGIGGLADEYCADRAYTGGEPGALNLTINTDRATLKWGNFVKPATQIPTGIGSCVGYNQGAKPADWDDNQSVGTFEGAGTNNTGMFRPVINCRMNSNAPPYCPVCYTSFKRQYDTYTGHTFLKCYAGDFNGGGRSDVLVHSGNSIQIFRSNGSALEHVSSAVERVPGSWQFKPNDQFFVADFNNDGKDEVAVFNSVDWVMPYLGLLANDGANGLHLIARYDGDIPGWGGFATNDKFYVADFDGNGRQDLLVFNGSDWSMAYVGMLRSNGSGFQVVRRFDGDIPGWGGLARNDQLFVGDFDGDGRDDLYIFNGADWSMSYIGMFHGQPADLHIVRRYDGDVPGWGGLATNDHLFVADFEGRGRAGLYIFNGADWAMPYLGMFRSSGRELVMVHRYDGDVPGWGGMARNDRFLTADINGDGKTDLFAYNVDDWVTEYLGKMITDGSSVAASWVGDWVGEWNLGSVDRYAVCNFQGATGQPDLFVFNRDWFGMMRGHPSLALQKIYYRWIHNYRYGRNW